MKPNYPSVLLVLITFFVISFITNILGPLFPSLIKDFNVSLTLAGLLPLSFFAAYGIASIPAGFWIEKLGEKPVMVMAFMMSAIGSYSFVLFPTFAAAMLSLFLIGVGMAMLQVAINPLLRVSGGGENFAFFSVLAQLVFGGAAALSPLVYSAILSTNTDNFFTSMVPEGLPWLSMYWIFAILSLLMVVYISVLELPKVQRNDDEKTAAADTYISLFKQKIVILYFLGIAAYVATEQGVANAISIFLQQYHQVDPTTTGAETVSQFWLMLTMGCFLGLILMKILDSRMVLRLFSVAAIISLTIALTGNKANAMLAFPMVGFFLSVMFSAIFSLALNSLSAHHGAFAGILCTGIVGGGIASPLIGLITDLTGDLRLGMSVIFITLIYILSISFWAKPLINNKTTSLFTTKKAAQ